MIRGLIKSELRFAFLEHQIHAKNIKFFCWKKLRPSNQCDWSGPPDRCYEWIEIATFQTRNPRMSTALINQFQLTLAISFTTPLYRARVLTGIRYKDTPWRWRDIPAYSATAVYNPHVYLSNFKLQALHTPPCWSPSPAAAWTFAQPLSRLVDPPSYDRRGISVCLLRVLWLVLGRAQHVLHHARAEGCALFPQNPPR